VQSLKFTVIRGLVALAKPAQNRDKLSVCSRRLPLSSWRSSITLSKAAKFSGHGLAFMHAKQSIQWRNILVTLYCKRLHFARRADLSLSLSDVCTPVRQDRIIENSFPITSKREIKSHAILQLLG
jgi:hypothetical protein